MRSLSALALLCLAIPATATAGTTTRTNEQQVQRQELKRIQTQCAARDKDRPGRDAAAKVECRVNSSVPPVVDPTPLFLP